MARLLGRFLLFAAVCAALGALAASPASAEREFRAFWADAFHNGFKSASQVDQMLSDVRASNCNVVVVQMRRRGDTYYPSQYEPFAPDADTNFDALAYLVEHAHNSNPKIEVHAWLCTVPVSQSIPSDPAHPYNKYPWYLTRDKGGNTYDGSNYNFDPGHPGVLDYLTNLFIDIVRRYDVDGVHFDMVRFANNTWGYNDVAVARYNAAYGTTGLPIYNDAPWLQWRRDQITALVRKVYANTIALKPNVKVSASTITWGDGPANDLEGWVGTSAYTSVLQDWRAWMEEGILDVNIPMTYYRDYSSLYAPMYDHWILFQKDHKYNRHLAVGLANYLNPIQNTIDQIIEARALTPDGNAADGICFYSYASTNDQNMNNTTQEATDAPTSDFYNALANVSTYSANPPFPAWAGVPDMPWKTSPSAPGHIKGNVTTGGGAWVDSATVTVKGPGLPPRGRVQNTDGTGFYAFIDLPAGEYTVSVESAYGAKTGRISASPHTVSSLDFDFPLANPTPVISNVTLVGKTSSSFTISWDTDLPSTSQIRYGTTKALEGGSAIDNAYIKHHLLTVSGLNCQTPYYLQVVSATPNPPAAYSKVICELSRPCDPPSVIVDNLDGTPLPDNASWNSASSAKDKYASNYRFCNTADNGTITFEWRPNLPADGYYRVYEWHSVGSNRSKVAHFTINGDGQTCEAWINQQANGGSWNNLLTPDTGIWCKAGDGNYVTLTNAAPAGKVVMADAVKFVLVPDTDPPSVPSNLTVTELHSSSATLGWNPSTDLIGISSYLIFRDGELAGASSSVSFADDNLVPGETYSYQISAVDVYGNESDKSAAITVTTPVPTYVMVMDGGNYTSNKNNFQASWAMNDSTTPAQYRFAVGSTPGGNNLQDWTTTDDPMTTAVLPDQPYNRTIYFAVQALSSDGTLLGGGVSDGITVARTVDSIAEAKTFADGTAIILSSGKPITASFGTYSYLQEQNGCAGIRIEGIAGSVGGNGWVAGILAGSSGERTLETIELRGASAETSITRPIGINNRAIGGGAMNYDADLQKGQRGAKVWHWVKIGNEFYRTLTDTPGMNNMGVLVKTWGKVTWTSANCFYIDDGSGYDDYETTSGYNDQPAFAGIEPAGPSGIKVVMPDGAGIQAPLVGSFVTITGVVSCYEANGNLKRLLRVRTSEDIN